MHWGGVPRGGRQLREVREAREARDALPVVARPEVPPEVLREEVAAEGPVDRRPDARVAGGSARTRWIEALGPSAGRAG